MKRLTLILLLLPLGLVGQDMRESIGVVTITDDYSNSDHKIVFLNEDGTIWYTLDLYEAWQDKRDFRILAFMPDYFLFQIRCKEQTPARFKVVVNEETGLTKFLVSSTKVKLRTWEEYVTNVFSVDFDRSNVNIYDKIGGKVIQERPGDDRIVVPKEIKGEWMRVIWSGTEEYPSDGSSNRTGWIKWRKDEKIIVKLYHLS